MERNSTKNDEWIPTTYIFNNYYFQHKYLSHTSSTLNNLIILT